MNLMNLLIIGAVTGLTGVAALQHLGTKPVSSSRPVAATAIPPALSPATRSPPAKYDTCYREEAVAHLSNIKAGDDGLPQAWHRQINRLFDSGQQSPTDLPGDIMSMPDLTGHENLPNLRVAMARERKEKRNELFKAVSRFSTYGFDDIFSVDGKARESVRHILFLWMGVDKVDPGSRGPFNDARELTFMEKLSGEAFLQIGMYPNPTVVAASHVKEGFNQITDAYYSKLVWHAAARYLFVPAPAGSGEEFLLNETMWRHVAIRAAAIEKKDDRLKFWLNAIVAIPNYHHKKGLSKKNKEMLERIVVTSGVTLDEALTYIGKRRVRVFWDSQGRSLQLQLTYLNRNMSSRQVCYSWLSDRYPDVAVRILP